MTTDIENQSYERHFRSITHAAYSMDVSEVDPQYVVQLPFGRYVKVSEIVKQIIDQLDGQTSCGEVAQRLSIQHGLSVTAEHVQAVVQDYLSPLGLIAGEATTQAESGLKLRTTRLWVHWTLLDGRRLARLCQPLKFLISWPVALLAISGLITLLAIFIELEWYDSEFTQGLSDLKSLPVLLIFLVSIIFHEIGHATACYKFGVIPSGMGVGMYLFQPVLFSDLSEAWILSRWKRIVISLAGVYFQLLFLLGISLFLLFTGSNRELMAGSALIGVGTLMNLNPGLRYDGYWILTDLLGIPNLHRRASLYMKKIVLAPFRVEAVKAGQVPKLKPPVKYLFYSYVIIYMFLMVVMLVVGFIAVGRLITHWDGLLAMFLPPLLETIRARQWDRLVAYLVQFGGISLTFVYTFLILSSGVYSLFRLLTKIRSLPRCSRPSRSTR